MLTLPPSVRLFLCTRPTDMRKSFDGLTNLARHVVGQDPLQGHLFIFFGRSRNLCKILWWDGAGFSLFARRLAMGRFKVPSFEEGGSHLEIDATELMCILEGIDLSRARRRPRWKPQGSEKVTGMC
jgi:transposase